jgi:hypothetical protein
MMFKSECQKLKPHGLPLAKLLVKPALCLGDRSMKLEIHLFPKSKPFSFPQWAIQINTHSHTSRPCPALHAQIQSSVWFTKLLLTLTVHWIVASRLVL